MYRIPNTDISLFNEYIEHTLSSVKLENKIMYITGDFNINLLSSDNHIPTSQFIDIMFSYSFMPLINKPTRITTTSATLIDNIFTNSFNVSTTKKGILCTDISDHMPIFSISSDIKLTKCEKDDVYKRVFNQHNKDCFKNLLSSLDFASLLNNGDSQTAFSIFHKAYHDAYNTSFPLMKITRRYTNRKPWLSDSLIKSIKVKNKLYSMFRRRPTEENEKMYKGYKNKLNHILRKEERNHIQNRLNQCKSSMKNTWQIIKEIINKKRVPQKPTSFCINNSYVTDRHIISEKFNNYFVNIGPTLASKIETSSDSPTTYIKSNSIDSFFLKPTNKLEILNIVKNLKICSSGWDDIRTDIFKDNIDIIIEPFVYLINLSLSCGTFPKELKIAKVLPLFKSGDVSKFNNYRPVSVLPVMSKVFEKVFYSRLIDFLKKNEILYNYQFGFREGHSTYMALLTLIDNIVNSFEKNEYTLGVFLDFSKAFDTIDHKILLSKLNTYGIRGVSNTWINDYLTDRQQYVLYCGSESSYQTIKCGVPQGSILGPLLFLLYINDLANVSTLLHSIIFADDTNLFISGTNLQDMSRIMNNELKLLVEWLKCNKLSLNVSKTNFMIFRSRKSIPLPKVDIKINEISIQEVIKTKFLGVILDNKLTWKQHITHTSNKASKSIGILQKAKKSLNHSTLITLYYSFIYPYLSYCIVIWGGTYNSTLHPLVKIQKIALRCICNKPRRTNTSDLFKSTGILKLSDIYYYNVTILMYNFYNKQLPLIFSDFFNFNFNLYKYETRQRFKLHTPKFKTNLGQETVKYTGALILNDVMSISDFSNNKSIFKKSIRHHLLSLY